MIRLNPQEKLTVFLFCIVKLALHLIADYHSGFQGDELLHIETGNHLAFGYMEFPPLIGLLAFIQNLFHSQSVFVHHIFAHLATVLILIYVSKIVIELGGSTRAIFLALLCILIAPGFGRSQQLFQPVVFSQLFWVLSFYNLTRYIKYLDAKYLWYLTFTVALGLMTKYDAVFFIGGLLSLLFFPSTRRALLKHKVWMPILMFAILVTPNLLWQYSNDFPVLKMFERLYERHLDKLTPLEVLGDLIVAINPLTLPVWLAGFFAMFHHSLKKYRPLFLSVLFSIVFLACSEGKSYYFFPIALTILPIGAVYWENVMLSKKKWILYPLTILLLVGALLIPFGLNLSTLEYYLTHEYKYQKENIEGGLYAVKFEERYSPIIWDQTLKKIKEVYDSMPPADRKGCVIWGKHYRQAGVVNLFREKYELPGAFSLHGSFYSWLPHGKMPGTIIAYRFSKPDGKEFFDSYFEEIIPVKTIYNPYAAEEEDLWQTIFICKNPKQSFEEMRVLFANRIYE